MPQTTIRVLFILVVGASGSWFTLSDAWAQTDMTTSDGFDWSDPYGTLELRHHVNTYYDKDDYLAGQEPSVHARMKLGARFYGGAIDAYGTLGVYKRPRTQVVYQRRPELELDFYPLRLGSFTLLQYNLIKLPFSSKDSVLAEDTGRDVTVDTSEGTVYEFGIAPIVRWTHPTAYGDVRLMAVTDNWTKLYSRPQYTSDYTEDYEEREFGLGPEATAEEEPIEDYAPHYFSHVMVASGFRSNYWPLYAEISGNHVSKFQPKYKANEGKKDYDYGAERHSYYKMRVRYEIDSRWSVTNDFYQYFGGLFASQRRQAERRFRNIARLSCNL